MLFFRTTKILKSKKKNASTKLNSRSRKIKKSKNFFVFFSERTRVGALKFFFFLFPRVCVALATRPKNLRAFVSSCEIFFPFPPQTLSFFSSLPSGLILFLIYPHTLAFPLAFVGVSHRGNAFPQFQCLRHSKVCRVKIKLDTRDAHPPIKSVQSARSA